MAAVARRFASFEAGNLAEWDSGLTPGKSPNANLQIVTATSAAVGSKAARCTYNGDGASGMARVWWKARNDDGTKWGRGTEVEFGGVFTFPSIALRGCDLIRVDNHATYGNPGGDVFGLMLRGSRVHVFQSLYGGSEQILVPDVTIPQGSKVKLTVRARLTDDPNQARAELLVDDILKGASVGKATSKGRAFDDCRYGMVNLYSQPSPAQFDMDACFQGPWGAAPPTSVPSLTCPVCQSRFVKA